MRHNEMRKAIYQYLAEYISQMDYMPSIREIGSAVGLKSPSTVHFHLKKLESEGLLTRNTDGGYCIVPSPRQYSSAPIYDHISSTLRPIPLVGSVAAGIPILAQEYIEEYIPFDPGSDTTPHFALRVCGYSMKDAGILPDDILIVRQQRDARNGDIVVAMIDGEATVKRLKYGQNGGIWLIPENDDFDPIDGTDAVVLGLVKGVIRRY